MKSENLNANHFVLDLKAGAELRARTRQDPQAGLKQAAQQFEGMLLQMMLKSMRDATPQDGMLNSDQTRFFTSILDQQLAQNLSAQSGLGFLQDIDVAHARMLRWATRDAALQPAIAFVLGWHGPRYTRLRQRVLRHCQPILWGKTPW